MRKAASFALVMLVATCVAFGASAQDGKKQRAARSFDRGVSALDAHEYKDALESFKTAYELMPHWRVLAHIGTCYAKLNQPVKAINALERYLEEGGVDVTADERKSAELMLQEQRNKVGSLKLLTSLPEAEAKIDGESVGRAPFGRILLLTGPHHVILLSGKDIYEADVDVEVGKETALQLPRTESASGVATAPASIQKPISSATNGDPSVDTDQSSLATDATLSDAAERRPRRAGTSVAFAVALVATGLGVGAAVPGWIAYGYHASSESSFVGKTTGLEATDGYSYAETCPVGDDGNFIVANEREAYYCATEWKRRWYEDNAKKSLIPAIIGTAVTGIGATLSVLFFLNAQWFDADDKSSSRLMLAPVMTGDATLLTLSGRF